MTALRTTVHLMLAILLGMVALACGNRDDAPDERLGQVEVTLTAVDGDGNTWRLPAGTGLYVSKGKFKDTLPLGGDSAVASFSLPVGMYSWELVNPFVFGNEWHLEREDAQNNVEIITASLQNPQPGSLLVTPWNATSLSLQFKAALGGTITFVKGTVQVDLDVQTTEETGGEIACGGVFETNTATFGATAPPSLATLLPDTGEVFDFALNAQAQGPWEMTSIDEACTPVLMTAIGSGQAGIQDLLIECGSGNDAGGTLCVDAAGGVRLFVYRQGAPVTDTFSGLGSTLLDFSMLVGTTLPIPAFDGETLQLSLLSGEHTSSATVFLAVNDIASGGGWYYAPSVGPLTFVFTPAPEP